MTVMMWGRPTPSVEEAKRLLVWPEAPEPVPVSAEERAGLDPDARVPGWRIDATTQMIREGWYGRDMHGQGRTSTIGTRGGGGPWYRSPADAAEALRRHALRQAVVKLSYVEAYLAETQNPKSETP